MSWDIKDIFARRLEFVTLALAGGVGMAELCRRFNISRKTGYKWCTRFHRAGEAGLQDKARSPVRRANQTAATMEVVVLALRRRHPTWGPRKLQRRLVDLGRKALPAVSTLGRILRRHGCIEAATSAAHRPLQRFCRAEPNQLWQMDFKGHFALQRGGVRCHPLTVLDDCSRYAVGLQACADEQTTTVQERLQRIFSDYGLPESILCDNGPPWGGSGPEHTGLAVWLLRLGVRVLHGRPFHPQTQGKDERFHRTLKADLLARHDWLDLAQTQRRFNTYRRLYNHDRPHDALALAVPASRYHVSARALPRRVPVAEYDTGELVRPVKTKGEITFRNRFYYVGRAFAGLSVALRPTADDGIFRLCYAAFSLGLVDTTEPLNQPKGHYYHLQPLPQKCYP
jgi:transposase InsO family protein